MTVAHPSRGQQGKRFNPAQLKAIRDALGLSVREFARPLGYTGQAVHRIERGQSRPSMQFLEAVSREYRVDLRRLFTG
jgi:transcriptional regulator with XRE-family HTH domain